MMNKLLLALAALITSTAALAIQPPPGDTEITAMAEDLCQRDSSFCNIPPPVPPKKPRQ